MSPRSRDTKANILRATQELMESAPYSEVTMAEVARMAKVSRQALYLHFENKTTLLLQLVDWMDSEGRLPSLIGRAMAAENPIDHLLLLAEASASYNADIARVGLALRAARDTDESARRAWDDRMARRLAAYRSAVKAVAAAGRLRPTWTVRSATDLIFSLTSLTMYEDLVVARRWPQRRYEASIVDMVHSLIVADVGGVEEVTTRDP